MNRDEPSRFISNDNENEIQGPGIIDDRYNQYDKLNFKYFVVAFLFILFSLINLSFYFINSFSFIDQNDPYSNNNENEGILGYLSKNI